MTITFDFDIDDTMAFQEHFLSNFKQFKRTRIFVTLLLPVMLVLLFLYYYVHDGMTTKLIGFGIFFVVMAIVWMLIIWKSFKKRTLARTRKLLLKNDKDNSIVFGVREMTLNDEGIFVKTPKSEALTKWIAVLKVVKDVNHYYLYITSMNAFVIPLRKIEDSVNELDSMIEKHVANVVSC